VCILKTGFVRRPTSYCPQTGRGIITDNYRTLIALNAGNREGDKINHDWWEEVPVEKIEKNDGGGTRRGRLMNSLN
jgi:hypothetical protein